MSVGLLAAGYLLFSAHAHSARLVSLQWAGSAKAADALVSGRGHELYRAALYWDLGALVTGYAGALVIAGILGRLVFWTTRMRRAAAAAIASAAIAGIANIAQDACLLLALHRTPMHGTWVFRLAEACSFLKFSLLLVAAVVGLIALCTTITRLVLHPSTRDRWASELAVHDQDQPDQAGNCIAPAPTEGGRAQVAGRLKPAVSWRDEPGRSADPAAHWNQNSRLPADDHPGALGVCVSGGGIRSASVTLGVLQALHKTDPSVPGDASRGLGAASHLVSVSGGGYTAGAYQMALHADRERLAAPDDVFAAGSPEEDHLRRHSSYLADTAGQWLLMLGVLLRCVLAGLVLLGLTVVVTGIAIGRFYRAVPMIPRGIAALKPVFLRAAPHACAKLAAKHACPHQKAPPWPGVPWGITLTVLAVLALAVIAYLVQTCWPGMVPRRLVVTGRLLVGLTGLLLAVGIVIPSLVWLSASLSYQVSFTTASARSAGGLTVLASYLGTLAATFWKKRTTLTKQASRMFSAARTKGGQVLPNSTVQILLLWLCIIALFLGMLLLAGWVAASAFADSLLALIPVVVLAALGLFVDESSLSLAPFYRQRLVSAFAVRRADRRGIAMAKALPDAGMKLSTWGKQAAGFPAVRFAAAANITGQDRTPPGRRAVSFVLDSEYTGGPQVGWVRTGVLEQLVSRSVKFDLQVPGAMSISGAAFAAAMGRQTRFFEVFLALTNVRLGAWLPNPSFVALKASNWDDWTVPGLPRVRRLDHLAREILGIHPSTARMLLCTDGGHYDNLGLVELLRRRCARIYCFDASGGGVPLADTLAGTLALAREELGVDVVLSEPMLLVPGGADQPAFSADGPLATLNGRISQQAVIKGDIIYPDRPAGARPGTLIFAQAALAKDLPYQVLEYSQNDAGFPRDGTADQFFNCDQFDAYQQLGRYLGEKARDLMVATVAAGPADRVGGAKTSAEAKTGREVKAGSSFKKVGSGPKTPADAKAGKHQD